MLLKLSLWPLLLLLTATSLHAQPSDTTEELNAYWSHVSKVIQEGDFEGYAATYHPDAVLVSTNGGVSYPIADALEGWKDGIEATKAGDMKAAVDFRLSQRLTGLTTAHETGIFHYRSQLPGQEWQSVYIHFEGLLVKKDGQWLMLMEYQKGAATPEEWEALK